MRAFEIHEFGVSEPGPAIPYDDQPRVIVAAAKQVARAIFFSLAIIIVSFVPVFLLEAQEGRMFRPLAFTKTSAMALASLAAGADGLLIEVHPEPDRAASDGAQSLDFAGFKNLRESLLRLAEPLGKKVN